MMQELRNSCEAIVNSSTSVSNNNNSGNASGDIKRTTTVHPEKKGTVG